MLPISCCVFSRGRFHSNRSTFTSAIVDIWGWGWGVERERSEAMTVVLLWYGAWLTLVSWTKLEINLSLW